MVTMIKPSEIEVQAAVSSVRTCVDCNEALPSGTPRSDTRCNNCFWGFHLGRLPEDRKLCDYVNEAGVNVCFEDICLWETACAKHKLLPLQTMIAEIMGRSIHSPAVNELEESFREHFQKHDYVGASKVGEELVNNWGQIDDQWRASKVEEVLRAADYESLTLTGSKLYDEMAFFLSRHRVLEAINLLPDFADQARLARLMEVASPPRPRQPKVNRKQVTRERRKGLDESRIAMVVRVGSHVN